MKLTISAGPHLHASATTRRLMLHVVLALLPAVAAGIYLFGYRAALVIAVSVSSCVLSEGLYRIITRQSQTVTDLSAVVTGLILGLSLPASCPLWIPAIGSLFAIVLAKQLFGGMGHNFINPALLARAVLLASWPSIMTTWTTPVRAFGSTATVDAVATATVLPMMNAGGTLSGAPALTDLLLGNMAGSIGETCKIAILIGLLFLALTGTIRWHIPVLMVSSMAAMSWILGYDPLSSVLTGSVLFGAVFMATDYVTSPMMTHGQCVYAILTGVLLAIIRRFGHYPEGTTYAIMIMNVLTPLIDRYTRRRIYGEVKKA